MFSAFFTALLLLDTQQFCGLAAALMQKKLQIKSLEQGFA